MSDEFGLKVGVGLGMVGWGRITSMEERRERRERIWRQGMEMAVWSGVTNTDSCLLIRLIDKSGLPDKSREEKAKRERTSGTLSQRQDRYRKWQ